MPPPNKNTGNSLLAFIDIKKGNVNANPEMFDVRDSPFSHLKSEIKLTKYPWSFNDACAAKRFNLMDNSLCRNFIILKII